MKLWSEIQTEHDFVTIYIIPHLKKTTHIPRKSSGIHRTQYILITPTFLVFISKIKQTKADLIYHAAAKRTMYFFIIANCNKLTRKGIYDTMYLHPFSV
jgi:hypothetical protein